MNGAREPVSLPMLVLQAVAAFLLLALPVYPLWDQVVRWGWVDAADAEGTVQASAAVFGACCLLVLGFAVLVRPQVPFGPARPAAVLRAYFPFLLAWAVLLVGYLRLCHALGGTVEPQPMMVYVARGDPGEAGFWIVLAVVVLIGPLAEEVVFRGFVQECLERVLGARIGVAAAAAVFGLVHGLQYALPVAVLGLFFGWLKLRHRSLLAPFVAHAGHNAIAMGLTWVWPRSLDLIYPR